MIHKTFSQETVTPEESNIYSSNNSSYIHEKYEEIFTMGVEQKAYKIREFDNDFLRYTESAIQYAIDYGPEIGIKETYNNIDNI